MNHSPPEVVVRIRNLGPVQRADVPFRPLTVLIGPNNSGKSITAATVHSALGAVPMPARRYLLVGSGVFRSARRARQATEDLVWEDLLAVTEAVLEGSLTESLLTDQILENLDAAINDYLEAYPFLVVEALESALGGDLDSLVRVKGGRRMPARIEVAHRDPMWSTTISLGRPSPTTNFERYFEVADLLVGEVSHPEELLRTRASALRTPETSFSFLVQVCLDRIFRGFPTESYYLPAARSGILQSHRVLAAAVVQSSSRVGLEEMRVPRMSGLTSEFISQLLTLGEYRRGAYAQEANGLEVDILQGHVAVDNSQPYPEISYETPAVNVPIHRSSSMIAELAPIVLYLRYVVERGGMLVIEEPEAHLHPESQVELARRLLQLVDRDLALLLTTHSDYLLTAINNGLRKEATSQLELFAPEEVLIGRLEDKVTAMLFEKSRVPDAEGEFETTVRELMLNADEGIPDSEFARIAQELYRETLTVDEAQRGKVRPG